MIDIDKNKLIKTYGIDDDNFISYLNKFKTLKKIINLGITTAIPVEKLRELYNIFVYYFSLGHDLNTIVNETIANVRSLFFFNGNGYLTYNLTGGDNITGGYSKVAITGRICQVRIGFTTAKQINAGDLIYDNAPAPIFEYRDDIYTASGNKVLKINESGIFLNDGAIPANNAVYGETTFIVER